MKKCVILMGLLALMGLSACLCLKTEEQTEEAAFNLATFNIRCPGDKGDNAWTNRLPRLLKVVADRQFDIVGLQEATPEQVKDLSKGLPEWSHVGIGRGKKGGGEAVCIFFKKARFELCDSGTFWLSENPDEPGSKSWNTAYPRICTWGVFRDRKTGRKFRFYNTHLDHKSGLARINGVKMILEKVKSGGTQEPVFLTGDMNCAYKPASAENTAANDPILAILEVLKNSEAISETPHRGVRYTGQCYRTESSRNLCIDYVFVSPGIRILSHATCDDRPGGKFASDHYPVAVRAVLD